MKYYKILLLCLFCFSCKNYNLTNNNQKQEKYEIHFQEHFLNDTVSLKINNLKILNQIIINSNEEIGYSRLKIILKSSNTMIVIYKGNVIDSISYDFKIKNKIQIILNGKEQKFKIDFSKGHYVGFSKAGEKLLLKQSFREFWYD